MFPELDLFFNYGYEGNLLMGKPVKTPELSGVSGASIWELHPTTGIWTPESGTRVVGIQSAFRHLRYMRGKSWWAVARVLEQADSALAAAVAAKLNQL
ncbi:hypothetical protein D3C86_870460 [compost metagenome]